jgi:alpha-N-arabinofuranosidase
VLRPDVDSATLSTDRYGDVPTVTAAATADQDRGDWSLFLTNRADSPTSVELDLRGLAVAGVPTARTIAAGDPAGPAAAFTETVPTARSGGLALELPPESWTVVTSSII